MSMPLPAPMRRALPLLPLYTMLCACQPHINLSQTAPPCVAIVEASGLLDPTPGATRPGKDSVGELGAFGVRQTGQLDKSNADKGSAKQVLVTCDQLWRAGLAKAQPHRFLGIF